MITSACSASASIRRTVSDVPDSIHAWLIEPVSTKAAPMAKAAAVDCGVAIPPANPIRTGLAYTCFDIISSRSASMVGNNAKAGRLSVCPPESASAVKSSAIGTAAAKPACSADIRFLSTSRFKNFSGGGERNFRATSTRETFAITLPGQMTSPL